MVSNTEYCKIFGAQTLLCFVSLEVLRRQSTDRIEIYRLCCYFNNAWLISWVPQISVSSQIHFTDINLIVMHNWEKKYHSILANKLPCSSNDPTFGHEHDLSLGQMCLYWQISSTQVVGRSWWCTFPIFQSGCLSTDMDLDKSVKKKFTRAYLKWMFGCEFQHGKEKWF